ncbi:late competence development ComFB family protein [Candidatus Gracilibacteria bacterium]|jgi:Late competence development protein ComFB|nr:late competence development ComFB family protein [Candidatus Gracilibacteria bacterium]NJP18294.1 late competence development ComFB family protein [Hydrococcus sp. CRU_1_1]
MKIQPETLTQTHENVMEILVLEELERQIKQYPEALTQYINKVEVCTFALNRLPALYASCEKGKNMQKLIGQKEYRDEIKKSVRQALAAIQRDPLRVSTPLISDLNEEYYAAVTALKNLQSLLEEENLLDYQELTWENLVTVMRHALAKAAWTGDAPQVISNNDCPRGSGEADGDSSEAVTQIGNWSDFRYFR